MNTTVSLVSEDTPEGAVVRVRDAGPGIPDYAKDKVFDKFYSLERPNGTKKSTGLGLPFVKEVAALHHGSISLNNSDGLEASLFLPVK